MAGDDSAATKEVYDQWLTPPQVKTLFRKRGISFDTMAKAIGARVENNLIATMAAVVVDSSGGNRMEYVELNAKIWRHCRLNLSFDFWSTGDIEIRSPGATGYSDTRFVASLFGVRFEPIGVQALLPGPDTTHDEKRGEVGQPDESAKERLSEPELKRFATLYLGLYPNEAKEIPAWNACKAAFPDFKVPRDYFLGIFRELRGPGTPGNPQLTKKP